MAALWLLGTILQDSGWTRALSEAGVASSGTAESFLVASSFTRTRQVDQTTACSLHNLMKSAYNHYCSDNAASTDILDFSNWREKRKLESPQFCFWDLVMSMGLTTLTLVRSFREEDFGLYRETLAELLPYFFANNNINYARWLTINFRDMMCIDERHLEIAREFHKGNFVCTSLRGAFQDCQLIRRINNTAIGLMIDGCRARSEPTGLQLRNFVGKDKCICQ